MGSGDTTPRFPRASRRRPQTPRPYDTYGRHHQSLGGSIIMPYGQVRGDGPIQRGERLGGILNHYYREAA